MVARYDGLVGDGPVENTTPRSLCCVGISVENGVPAGIAHEQRRNIGGVGHNQQLFVPGVDGKNCVASSVAVCRDGGDARGNFLSSCEPGDVCPIRQGRLNAFGEASAVFWEARSDSGVRPECNLGLGHDDLRVRIHLRVGVLFHQPEDVIGVEVGDDNGVDGILGNPCRFHVGGQPTRRWGELRAGSGVEHNGTVRGLHKGDCERDLDIVGGLASGLEGSFRIRDRGVANKAWIMRFVPVAVVDCGDLDVSNLELEVSLFLQFGGARGAQYCERLADSEGGGGGAC